MRDPRRRFGAMEGVYKYGFLINAEWRIRVSYSIIGFGKIGQALARAFARKNIDVTVASRRPPRR